VLIRESRFDSAFVSSHCAGFEEGLRELILERYDPGSVSGRTGVPVVEIIRVARDFSASRPALALCEGYPFSKGLEASWAALVLNALVGSVDAPGGVLLAEPLPAPHLPQLPPAHGGLGTANGDGHLPPSLDGDKGALDDAPVELLVFMGRGTSLPIAEKSLEQAGFIVSFSSYLDETTEAADLVLPESAFLECWQGAVPEPALAGPHIALARPGAAPLLDTRDSADVLLTVARELGGAVAEALPWSSFTDLLKEQARVLFEARRGSPYSSPFEGDWLRQLEHAGLWSRSYGDFDDFWEKCLQAGGWWDPGFEPGQALRSLETASGKIELFPEFIRRLLEGGRKPVAISPPAGHPPSGEDFPLALQVFEVLPLAGLTDRNQASLYEILGQHVQASWEPWAELNPDTAARLNLHDRELVWIESPTGRIRVRVILYPGAMPLGVLQKAGGRWVPKGTERAVDLLSPSRDAGSGLLTGIGTRVRVVRG
jgi:anaerobic selenocysteine-containing dehydrogenase